MCRPSAATLVLTVLGSLIVQIEAEVLDDTIPAAGHSFAASEVLRRQQVKSAPPMDGITYCWAMYPPNGICTTAEDLRRLCVQFESESTRALWADCLCGNGYIPAKQACDWCLEDFNLAPYGLVEGYDTLNASDCVNASASIAPIPSTILASLSSFNMSNSAFLATAFYSGVSSSNLASTGHATPSTTYSVSSPSTSTGTTTAGASLTSMGSATTGSIPPTTKAGSNANGAGSWGPMSNVSVIIWTFFSVVILYSTLL